MAGYSGKTAPNSTSQMDSVAWSPKAPTLKPTSPNAGQVKGDNLPERTRSSAAQDEKLYERVSGASTK